MTFSLTATQEEYRNISWTCRTGDREAKAQPQLRSPTTAEEELVVRHHLHKLGIRKSRGPGRREAPTGAGRADQCQWKATLIPWKVMAMEEGSWWLFKKIKVMLSLKRARSIWGSKGSQPDPCLPGKIMEQILLDLYILHTPGQASRKRKWTRTANMYLPKANHTQTTWLLSKNR